MNDLTVSNIERQNVLNNRYAVDALQENLGFTGMLFEGEYRFTKKMVADFYEVDISTIDRYLSQYADELKHNGYVLSKGKQLKELKLQFAHVINEASKTTQLGLFNFRAVLNMGMLLTESEKAKQVRARILDIVISTINKRAGGGTKYINTRDIDFLPAAIEEDNYRKNFTTAVGKCVQGHKTFKFMEGRKNTDANYWSKIQMTPIFHTWSGLAFERVCLLHSEQIKKALGISGVITNEYSWRTAANDEHPGAQVDLLIDRSDKVINLCEIKYSDAPYTIDKRYMENLRNKVALFRQITKTRKGIALTMITSSDLVRNSYSMNNIHSQVTADDLFATV